MKRYSIFLALCLFFIFSPMQTFAVTVNLPVQDAWYQDIEWNSHPDISNGYDSFAINSLIMHSVIYADSISGGMRYTDRRGLLEIDFSSIPHYSTINSVELALTGTTLGGGASSTISMYGHFGDGLLTPDDAIGNSYTGEELGLYQSATSGWVPGYSLPGTFRKTFLITASFIEDVINNNNGYAAFQLIDRWAPDQVGVQFYTTEHTNASYRPLLTVDYDMPTNVVPEPTSMMLFVLLILGIAGIKRCKF